MSKKLSERKEVALVLSSGGARGIAHIGVIEALLERGYTIHSVAGCSMGAVVGGVFAAGKLDEFKEWLCNLDKVDLFKLFDFTLSSQGFIKGEKVFNELKGFVSDCNIEDLKIPYAAVAVDILEEKEVVFKEGSLFQAMRASAAIPSIITPAIVDDIELVDGGVLNPIPLSLIKRKRNDVLVAVDVNARGKYHWPKKLKPETIEEANSYTAKLDSFVSKLKMLWGKSDDAKSKKMGMFDIMTKSLDLMQDKLSDVILEKHQPDVLVSIPRSAAGTFEFYKAKQLVEAGKRELEKSLKKAELS